VVVFFDIGNVLLSYDAKRAARRIAWELRRHPLKVLKTLWAGGLVDAVERGSIPPDQLYALFRTELGYEGTFAGFRRMWCDNFALHRRNAALLKELAAFHKVYLLSNTNALHYEFIRANYKFPGHVHGAVLSYELGLRKPEAAIYKAALRMAKASPKDAVFIDDLEENVDGARKVGMTGIHHKPDTDLRSELKKLGVL
jgi:glucose-1-phosphatase